METNWRETEKCYVESIECKLSVRSSAFGILLLPILLFYQTALPIFLRLVELESHGV